MNVLNNNDNDDDVDYECPICYVAFGDESENTVIQCRNGHSFHGKCLEQWDQNSESSGTTLNCPTCSVTMNKRLPITNRFATKASKLAEEVKLLKAQLAMKVSEISSTTGGLQQQQNSQSSSDFNVTQFADDNEQIKYLSEGFRSYVKKKINDFIQNDTAEQLWFSHKVVGTCRSYICKTGRELGLLYMGKKSAKKKKGIVLRKKSEEQKKRAALKRERKKIHNANIRANSIQINTDAGCFVKESKGKPKHWYCEHCVFERKYEDHINFAYHLFNNKHKTQQNMSNRLKEYAKNGELFVNNKQCLTFPIAQGIAATWKCKECNFTVDYDNPYRWIWHKNWANKLHAGQEINMPKRGFNKRKKKQKKRKKKKKEKQASTSYRTIMKRKHVDGRDSVDADRKRSKTLMHYPCNTRVSMVWPDNIRYHGVVSKIDKRGRHTVIWDEDQTETIDLKYSQLEKSKASATAC